MGYRFQRQAEEQQPIYAPQGVDPNVFLEAQRRSAQARMQQSSEELQASRQVDQMNLDSSRQMYQDMSGAVDKGIGAYREAKKVGREEKQFQTDQRQAEEDFSASQVRNLNEKTYGGKKMAAETRGLEANADLTTVQKNEAEKTQEFNDAINKKTGTSNRQTVLDSGVENATETVANLKRQGKTEDQRLLLAEKELEHRKDMAPLERDQMRASISAQIASVAASRQAARASEQGINEIDKANRIKAAKARLLAPGNLTPEQVMKEIVDSGTSPADIAEAVVAVKDKNTQDRFMANLQDPFLQRNTQSIIEGHNELDASRAAIGEVDDVLAQYADSNAILDDGAVTSSIDRLKDVARHYNLDAQAADLDKLVKLDSLGRTERLNKFAATIRSAAASRVKRYAPYNPAFGQAANELLKANLTGGGKGVPENNFLKNLRGGGMGAQGGMGGQGGGFGNQQPAPQMQYINNQAPAPIPGAPGSQPPPLDDKLFRLTRPQTASR